MLNRMGTHATKGLWPRLSDNARKLTDNFQAFKIRFEIKEEDKSWEFL